MHINSESLKEFMQGDDTLLGEMATMFVESLPDCKARLSFAVRGHDPQMLREVTHQLASRLGYLQALELSQQVRQLEQRAINNQLDGTAPLVDQLVAYLEEVVRELRQLTGLPLLIREDD